MPTPQDIELQKQLLRDIQKLDKLCLLRYSAESIGNNAAEFDQQIQETEAAIEARMAALKKGKGKG